MFVVAGRGQLFERGKREWNPEYLGPTGPADKRRRREAIIGGVAALTALVVGQERKGKAG